MTVARLPLKIISAAPSPCGGGPLSELITQFILDTAANLSMSNPVRPIGPRSIQRSPSPAPFAMLDPTPPLNIRKAPKPGLMKLHIPASPGPPSSSNLSNNSNSDSPSFNASFAGGYYGGPIPAQPANGDAPDQMTIRPPAQSGSKDTSWKPLDDMGSLRQTISQIDLRTPPPTIDPSNEEVRPPVYGEDKWSDEYLEDLERLGEGAGGAVHKVMDTRTKTIMARKTITTREAPPRQLLRELSFMSNTVHINICHFFGAYISPSSSEVKMLMEICEGGSLEAIGKRIKEFGGRVSEKVAGRLAEGVSRLHLT